MLKNKTYNDAQLSVDHIISVVIEGNSENELISRINIVNEWYEKMLYGNIINRIKEFLLKNLPEITYILFLATFLERFSYFLIIPFLSIYLAQNYHLSGLEIGLVVSTFAITSLFMSFIAAPFIDKIDKKSLFLLVYFYRQ